MMRRLGIWVLSSWLPLIGLAQQAVWVTPKHAAEINGVFNGYVISRQTDSAFVPEWQLRDLRVILEGTYDGKWDYKLQLDLANALNDTFPSVIIDAHATRDLPQQFDLILGYQLLPFSRNSIIGFRHSPFYQRTLMADGNLYARRDLGVTLRKKAFQDQGIGYLGVYQGTGRVLPGLSAEAGITAVARLEYAYPARFRYEEIDVRHSPHLRWVVGINALGSTQTQDSIRYGLPFMTRGGKWIVGLDASVSYQGLSVQGEYTYATVSPRVGQVASRVVPASYQLSGGFISGNYYIRPLSSVLAVRYERYLTLPYPDAEYISSARVAWAFLMYNDFKRIARIEYCFYQETETPVPGLERGLRAGLLLAL